MTPGLFDDLDDFAAAPVAPATPPAEPFTRGFVNTAAGMEPCRRCQGTGHYARGNCYTCGGSGRVKARRSSAERTRKADAALAWTAAHPAESAWMLAKAPTFDFAASMLEAVQKWGELTEKQMDAVRRCIAKDAARTYDRNVRAEYAAIADMSRIVAAFNAAREHGARKAALRLNGLTLSLAPATGKNPNCIYAKRGDTYLGKIDEAGIYRPSYASTPADLDLLRKANENPLEQAVAYARQTGECSCCGRELTDPVSIELGIGPICKGKFSL